VSNEPSIFIDGLRISKPKDNAPDWIKANCIINCDELEQYIRANHNESGEIRFQIKESKAGRLYCAVDTYQRPQQDGQQQDDGYGQQSNNSQTPEPQSQQQPGSPAPFPTDSQEDQLDGLEEGGEELSDIPFI